MSGDAEASYANRRSGTSGASTSPGAAAAMVPQQPAHPPGAAAATVPQQPAYPPGAAAAKAPQQPAPHVPYVVHPGPPAYVVGGYAAPRPPSHPPPAGRYVQAASSSSSHEVLPGDAFFVLERYFVLRGGATIFQWTLCVLQNAFAA